MSKINTWVEDTTFKTANPDSTVWGIGTNDQVALQAGAKNVTIRGAEVYHFAGKSTDFQFQNVKGEMQVFSKDGTALIAKFLVTPGTEGETLKFNDGSFTAHKAATGNGVELKGLGDKVQTLTSDQTPAVLTDVTIDPAGKSTEAGTEGGDPTPPTPGEGNTFTLTTGTDIWFGTEGNDKVIAGITSSLNPGDELDGKGGIDTLKIYGDNNEHFTDVSIKNIEIVENYTGKALDVSSNADVTEVWAMKASTNQTNANLLQKIGLASASGASNTEKVAFTGTDTANDSATIMLKDAGKTVAYTGLTVDTTSAGLAAIENLTIEATGKNDIGTLTVASVKSLTVTGGESVKLVSAAGNTALNFIDASKAGSIDIAVNDLTVTDLTFMGGTGNDKIALGLANINAKDKLDGGAGTDTLILTGSGDITKAEAANIKGFEIVQFDGTGTQDMDAFAGNVVNRIVVSNAGALTVDNITGAALNDIRFMDDNSAAVTLTGKNFDKPLQVENPTAKIVLDNAAGATNGVDASTSLTFANVKGLTVESLGHGLKAIDVTGTDSANANSIAGLTTAALEKLTVIGNESVAINSDDGNVKLSTVDASELTNGAGIDFTLAARANADTLIVKGSAGNDKLAVTGDHTDDTFTFVGNGGDDLINFGGSGSGDMSIVEQAASFTGSSMAGASINVSKSTGSDALETGDVVTISFTKSALVGTIADAAVSTAAITEGNAFEKGTNVFYTIISNEGIIQIDVDGDGFFNAANDYQVTIYGSANDTFGYANGVFTFSALA